MFTSLEGSQKKKEVHMNYPVIDIKATGERIRQLRIEHHLKVEEIAEYMGFGTDQAIYKWQRG